MRLARLTTALLAVSLPATAQPLRPEATIPLDDVKGRIDHLAIDSAGNRLFLAALGNNTVEILDLAQHKRVRTLRGFAEPQGLLYVPGVNRLYVANGSDGTLRIFDAATWKQIANVTLGDDADNVRLDPATRHVWVGYGGEKGALAELDLDGKVLSDIKLEAHPESFQLERNGSRIFVNLPKARRISIADRQDRTARTLVQNSAAQNNYPLAIDEAKRRIFAAYRNPARLAVVDSVRGNVIATLDTVGDADDVFYDAKRHRIYVIGGEGAIGVIDQQSPDRYQEIGRIRTTPGARTGLFSPDVDRLFVAARREGAQKAAILVYIPGN